jgi:hypothetical protein
LTIENLNPQNPRKTSSTSKPQNFYSRTLTTLFHRHHIYFIDTRCDETLTVTSLNIVCGGGGGIVGCAPFVLISEKQLVTGG